jgi:small conductance mechanosensitive channel
MFFILTQLLLSNLRITSAKIGFHKIFGEIVMEKTATDWLSQNQGVMTDYLINIVIAIAILVIGRMIGKAIAGVVSKAMEKKGIDKAVIAFIHSIVYSIILVAVVLMALGQIGIETTSFIAILGAAGLAVGLALQGSLSNFASGVLIILFRPFKSGDYIEAAGVAGSVNKIEIFATTLKTPDNKVVIVPNAEITGGVITNFSREERRRVEIIAGISYDSDIRLAKEVLEKIVASHELVLDDPAHTIAVSELADSSVNIVVRVWAKTSDFWKVKFDLTESIKLEFDKAGVVIPFPQMDVHVHKTDQ